MLALQVNWNVFGYEVHEAKKFIVETSKTVRGPMLMDAIEKFADNLNVAYDALTDSANGSANDCGWTTDELRHFTSRTIFHAIFDTVFGRSEQHVFSPDMVFANFEVFHKYVQSSPSFLAYFASFRDFGKPSSRVGLTAKYSRIQAHQSGNQCCVESLAS